MECAYKSQKNIETRKQSWKIHTSQFQKLATNKATVIRIMWYFHQKVHIDKQNRIEKAEINPHIYGQLISDKCSKAINLIG